MIRGSEDQRYTGSERGEPESGNPDGSGRGKIPGFGSRQNLVTFELKWV